MFTIKKTMNRDGYTVSIGDGHPCEGLSCDEVIQTVLHYFNDPEAKGKHNPKVCPFCKQIKERAANHEL